METTPQEQNTISRDTDFTPSPLRATPPPPRPTTPILKKRSMRIALSVLVLALFGTTVVGYVSLNSAPDTVLYPIKVYVTENAVALVSLTDAARTDYVIMRLERRLSELQALTTDTSTSSPETIATIANLIEAHARDATATLTDSSLADENKIMQLARLSAITRAEEILLDTTEEFASGRDAVERAQETARTSLASTIETYASTTDAGAVHTFLGAQIQSVMANSPLVARGSNAERLMSQRVDDTQVAITDGHIATALISIVKAQEAITVDGYLFSAERGPTDGAPVTPSAIPEGN